MNTEELKKKLQLADIVITNRKDIIHMRDRFEDLSSSVLLFILGIISGISMTFFTNSLIAVFSIDSRIILIISGLITILILYYAFDSWKRISKGAKALDNLLDVGLQAVTDLVQEKSNLTNKNKH